MSAPTGGIGIAGALRKNMQEIYIARDDLGRWVPGGNDISPPVSGGQPASADEPPTPAPQADEGKVARLGERRARHGND